jgi:hypothetical protein
MAKIINAGYTDTAYSGTPVLTRGKLNFAADFRIAKDSPDTLTLINLTSPFDRIEENMLKFTNVPNIYDKTAIDPSVYAPSRRGVNLYTKLTNVYQVTDDADAMFVQHLPVTVSITIRAPQSPYIDSTTIQTVLARAVSTFYDTGSETTTRLNAALRGSLKPSDL